MKVLKFGGSSVGSSESIREVGSILKDYHDSGESLVVVVSAFKGITNLLQQLGDLAVQGQDADLSDCLRLIEERHFGTIKELLPLQTQSHILAQVKRWLNELEEVIQGVALLKELSPRSKDLLLSFGERLSAYIIHEYLKTLDFQAYFVDAREIITTDGQFGAAKVDFEKTNSNIAAYFQGLTGIPIVTGFVSANASGQTTTLGRGGSDYTAAIIGSALDVQEIEIWTDVDGVMTADPNIVARAFSLPELSYVEAMELTHFGAKVIYPPTLQPAFTKSIPLRIRNTFNRDFPGTIISREAHTVDMPIKGISSINQVSLVNVQGSGLVGVPGIASRLFGALGRENINIILITQASSEHSICFAIVPEQAEVTKSTIEAEFKQELAADLIDPIIIENDHSVVAIIGENMRRTTGIADKLFGALGKNGINVVAIAQGSSELNVSVVIDHHNLVKALKALHGAFFIANRRRLNVFMVGAGLIGGTLLKQISQQFDFFNDKRLLEIRLCGLANSKKMLIDEEGIDLENWQELLDNHGRDTDLEKFVVSMQQLNLANSVFVDNTAGASIPSVYQEVLDSSISIVTPNKVANSQCFEQYQDLKETAFQKGVAYLYETNVGAGLPVINTINDLVLSGDHIVGIQGVLSGTISYIFNSFKGDKKFSEIVREAQQKGYTEPDPRDDLNGKDVARKILILAREVGIPLELDQVEIEPLLAPACFEAETVDKFFKALEEQDQVMSDKVQQAAEEGRVLRYVAQLKDGQAKIKLIAVGPESLFYGLSGSDNIIAINSSRYSEKPLLIRGPGAGAEVTAAGVFAELIKISEFLVG
ncbi:MAG: bifunctional aspartate kinase/homoserine dehydrogenase I [Cyclobacteriaceae bacterium]|nr:bifunctional aspartate kinase/homoserine dehydrogenase I [Cyclobacteriaceae bacterium]